jgi:hypothetical protein
MLVFFFFWNLTLFVVKLRVLVLFSLLYRYFYYISLLTRPSCKVIWISCGCIFWWVCFFSNGPFSRLIFKNIKQTPLLESKLHFLLCYIFALIYIAM